MAKKEIKNKKETSKNVNSAKISNVEKKEIEIIEDATNDATKEDETFVAKEEPTADIVIEKDVADTIEEVVEAPVKITENAVDEVKKITKKVDRTFGYLWNGQAIDF